MRIRPLHDHVVLEVLEAELRVSPGGIALPASDKVGKRARVVEPGPGRLPWRSAGRSHTDAPTPEQAIDSWARARVRCGVEPGDVVIYQDHRVRWHTGRGEWPEVGDLALVPADALLMVCDSEAEAERVEVLRLGVVS